MCNILNLKCKKKRKEIEGERTSWDQDDEYDLQQTESHSTLNFYSGILKDMPTSSLDWDIRSQKNDKKRVAPHSFEKALFLLR